MNCKVCGKSVGQCEYPEDRRYCQECRDRLSKALKDSFSKTCEMTVRAYFQNFGIPDSKIDELLKEVPPLWFFRGEE